MAEDDVFRANILNRVVFLFIIQTYLVGHILKAAVESTGEKSWLNMPDSAWIVLARFVCGLMMHISLSDELEAGMTSMKYSLNHTWKFINWKLAFLSGLL